ncbi:MAG TPA: LTA synthase family protein, partial [Candidatus Binatia bacterium]
RLKLLLSRLALVLALYTLARVLFLAFNYPSYQQAGWSELLTAFAVGLRFDVAAICRTNAGFIVLSMLPFMFVQKSWYEKLLKIVFLASNIPFLILNIVDFEYQKYTGQRASLSLLDMSADIPSQIGQLSFHYWYLAVISAAFVFLLYWLHAEPSPTPDEAPRSRLAWARDLLVFILVIALAVIGGRGGLQRRRFTTALAAIGDKENLAQLALNSTYTMINSQRKCENMSKVRYFANDEELKKNFPAPRLATHKSDARLDNVVIIFVESLSADYTGIGNPGHGFTPFLDSLAQRGLYFTNSFANGRRSIDAPPSIFAGLPHLKDETFFCTQHKRLLGLGSILKERGYKTSFFHGGKNGTMSFDTFSLRMGFDTYYGLNEYPRPEDSDGIWGIYDEPFLQYFAQQLSRQPQPFASAVFTLSTHNPYQVPAQYAGKLPTGELPILQTVAYFDIALKNFFATAEKLPWYDHTLFIITGDHIGPPKSISPRMIDSYRVPIIFFHPGGKLPKVSRDKIVQHVDIEPSILDYLGIDTAQTLPFGHSIFDSNYSGLALGQKDGNFWISDKNYYLEFRPGVPSKLFATGKLDTAVTDKPEIQAGLEDKLKAYIQWFTNGLAEDNLYRGNVATGPAERSRNPTPRQLTVR